MERAMGYVTQGSKRIGGGMKNNDMMEVEAGHKRLEFGQERQNEAKKRVCDTSEGKFIVNYSKSTKVKDKSLLCK